MFKVNNKDTRKTPLASFWVFLLLTLNIFHTYFHTSLIVPKKLNYEILKIKNRLKVLHRFYYLYFGHTGWSHFQIAQSTTQIRHLIQFHVNGVFSFFEQTFPRICLNKVPIVSVQHFYLVHTWLPPYQFPMIPWLSYHNGCFSWRKF